ncbi:PREDICTED: palmitoleoyl-protein carboxylesterase NOTUM [Dipodomys ordii]|uniref:Palmitoleoyl-protein carboxylesterase NOTUM n=1 Tax=Dipodomys ordii TaxID=10020 RepID=A0A1S3GIC8_DIPOR|nr:PREDICTED: palmitoleoyl-protein carboxylesterase NOTUM [Dipodomys ordii]
MGSHNPSQPSDRGKWASPPVPGSGPEPLTPSPASDLNPSPPDLPVDLNPSPPTPASDLNPSTPDLPVDLSPSPPTPASDLSPSPPDLPVDLSPSPPPTYHDLNPSTPDLPVDLSPSPPDLPVDLSPSPHPQCHSCASSSRSYYLKESKGSRRWLLFLEGGWYCFSRENCDSRYNSMRRLMSSKDWPRTRTGTGILSSQPEENPHWWNANMVFIPYCSSDVWSGTSSGSEKNEYAFMGALIIREVVRELLGKGLSAAKVLLLAGSSAGGTGVLLNVDRVAEQLEELGYPAIHVRGLADSGWFLDNKQYRRTDCLDTITCAPTEAVRRGIRYWNGMVPDRCRRQFKEGEEWNCFFGYKVYPTLRCPVFVVQWLFDEAQLTVDNVHLTGQPVQEGQWLYIQNLGRELRSTLKDVPASFAPACLSHEIIIRSHWTDIQVKGTSLPRALHCWDRSLHDSHKASKAPLKGCPFHLVDSCPWPHCNPSCPTIRDQFTGQEMNVAQFLMHMGFDVQTVAQQQGLEPSRLLGMLSTGS